MNEYSIFTDALYQKFYLSSAAAPNTDSFIIVTEDTNDFQCQNVHMNKIIANTA